VTAIVFSCCYSFSTVRIVEEETKVLVIVEVKMKLMNFNWLKCMKIYETYFADKHKEEMSNYRKEFYANLQASSIKDLSY